MCKTIFLSSLLLCVSIRISGQLSGLIRVKLCLFCSQSCQDNIRQTDTHIMAR